MIRTQEREFFAELRAAATQGQWAVATDREHGGVVILAGDTRVAEGVAMRREDAAFACAAVNAVQRVMLADHRADASASARRIRALETALAGAIEMHRSPAPNTSHGRCDWCAGEWPRHSDVCPVGGWQRVLDGKNEEAT